MRLCESDHALVVNQCGAELLGELLDRLEIDDSSDGMDRRAAAGAHGVRPHCEAAARSSGLNAARREVDQLSVCGSSYLLSNGFPCEIRCRKQPKQDCAGGYGKVAHRTTKIRNTTMQTLFIALGSSLWAAVRLTRSP